MYKRYAEHVKKQRENLPQNDSAIKTSTEAQKAEKTGLQSGSDVAAPGSVKTARREGVQSLQRHESTVGKDVMISYSHQNRPTMRKIKGTCYFQWKKEN